MSMLFGLRGMTNLPVESMETGGFLWITDLTIADPYIICPLTTSVSTYVMLMIAADGFSTSQLGPIARHAIKIMPVILLPFTWNFPAVSESIRKQVAKNNPDNCTWQEKMGMKMSFLFL